MNKRVSLNLNCKAQKNDTDGSDETLFKGACVMSRVNYIYKISTFNEALHSTLLENQIIYIH